MIPGRSNGCSPDPSKNPVDLYAHYHPLQDDKHLPTGAEFPMVVTKKKPDVKKAEPKKTEPKKAVNAPVKPAAKPAVKPATKTRK
jgi:hypothetical protein